MTDMNGIHEQKAEKECRMSEKAEGDDVHARIMTHEQMLAESGFDICSPITGSMRPMIRPQRDSVLFVVPEGRLKKYDVALYRRNGQAIMHRVIQVLPEGYVIRGDNSDVDERVGEAQILAVMKGFYRDERYISRKHPVYQVYVHLWLWLREHPLAYCAARKAKRLAEWVFCKFR